MIQRFLEVQCAVISVLRSKELTKLKAREDLNTLTDEDISLCEEMVECLKTLKDITTMLCTESSSTVSIIVPLLEDLKNNKLKPSQRSKNDMTEAEKTIEEMKKQMKADLQGRYTTNREQLCLASAMDPRFKALPFLEEQQQESVYSALANLAMSKATAIKVKVEPGLPPPALPAPPDLPETVKKEPEEPQLPALAVPDASAKTETEELDTSPPSSLLQGLLGDVFITGCEPAKSKCELVQAEIVKYRSERPIPLNSDPLQWWKVNAYQYPMLFPLAKALLCIPATSVPSERVFSTAGDIVTQSRAALKAKHVDMLIFLKKNT